MSKTKASPSSIKETIPLPEAAASSIVNTNSFLAKFASGVYSYKQKEDLRVNFLKIICHIIQYDKNPDDMSANLKLIIELRKSGEIIVLSNVAWPTSEDEIAKGEFQTSLVEHVENQLHILMRHGLATVIRTAQKKGADIIL
jgi:hypothetical protein